LTEWSSTHSSSKIYIKKFKPPSTSLSLNSFAFLQKTKLSPCVYWDELLHKLPKWISPLIYKLCGKYIN
jgi:hypothetical protein